MKRVEIEPEEFQKLVKLYLCDCLSHRQIEVEMGKGFDWCQRVLKENGLFVSKPTLENPKKGDIKKEHNRRKRELWNNGDYKSGKKNVFSPEKKYKAICKKTKEEYLDYNNQSGSLTLHLQQIIPGFQLESGYKRRQVLAKTGKPWFYEYFDFIEVVDQPKKTVVCLECGWETTDANNDGGWLTQHIRNEHDMSITSYVKNHKEQKHLFSTVLDKEAYERRFDKGKENVNFVVCLECGKKMSKINNKHLATHGMTLLEYKIKHGVVNPVASEAFTKKIKEVYKKGLKHYESTNGSSGQMELYNILKEKLGDVKLNNKKILKGIEIDILCEQKKFAIEYNGLYYHSELSGKKDRNYHLSKLKQMNEAGYQLIHIFEDEWQKKKDIVISKIFHLLNVFSENRKVHARKCVIAQISPIDKNTFLDQHHIQGADRSELHLGALFEDELIAVMTFDSARGMHGGGNNQIELKRFCIKQGILCSGIMGKMLAYFKKHHAGDFESIVSFADRRWTVNEDNIYTKNGFVLDSVLKPDYSYYNSKYSRLERLTKYQFGKKSLKKKFPETYSNELSEWEIMQLEGFDRIWDCGKLRYVHKLNR